MFNLAHITSGKRGRLFTVAGLVLASSVAFANTDQPVTYSYTLDNGLRLLVRADHRAPVAVTQIWYGVGSSYEYEGITGISHMLEHLMFKGTHAYPEGEFVKIIAENGGEQNAFTSNDYTVYYEELEARRLPLAFLLESDRMQNLQFSEEELLKERDVVAEERRLRTEDNPVARMYERFNATAQATSPYRFPVIGWMDDINRYSEPDIQHWYKTWYAPNNAVVVVVGDVDPDMVLKLAKQYFGNIPASQTLPKDNKATIKVPPDVPPLGERKITISTPALIPYVYLGFNVPSVKTASEPWEPYALDVLVGILVGGESARLNRHLIREQLVASEVGALYNPYDRLDTLLLIAGIPGNGHTPEELEKAFLDEVHQLQTSLVDPSELKRVKNQVIANEIFSQDSLTEQAIRLGSLASVGLDPALAEEYPAHINAVTAEEVKEVAQRYLTAERLTIGVLNPQPLAGSKEKK